MPSPVHCLRDATYWRLPRKRLTRVLGRRIRVVASSASLDRVPVTFFVEDTDERQYLRIERRDLMFHRA
jgi:hypothetical protein